MKIVKEEVKRDRFLDIWEKELKDFKEHVLRIQTQYKMSRELKEKMPLNEMYIHMDFAENYSCKTAEEIQSAYWNASQVTLHPIVIYKKDESGQLIHRSFVAVSDSLVHASSTVIAILDKFYSLYIPELQNVKFVHYWTDSPTSQYRNRYIFDLILEHKKRYGFDATWNYFESGHGKGPCDGVGGTVKRLADQAVNAQKANIQDADDFYSWAENGSIKAISFFFVRKADCEEQAEELRKCALQPVKGTMSLHTCTKQGVNLLIANTSCYCDNCIEKEYCQHWTNANVTRKTAERSQVKGISDKDEHLEAGDKDVSNEAQNIENKYCVDEYVAAVYGGQ